MDNKNVVIDINSIVTNKQLMDSEYDKLVALLNKYKGMFEDTKAIYDTESATIYRKLATSYIDYVLGFLNNDFKPYMDNLDVIKKTYVDEISTVTSQVQGGAE